MASFVTADDVFYFWRRQKILVELIWKWVSRTRRTMMLYLLNFQYEAQRQHFNDILRDIHRYELAQKLSNKMPNPYRSALAKLWWRLNTPIMRQMRPTFHIPMQKSPQHWSVVLHRWTVQPPNLYPRINHPELTNKIEYPIPYELNTRSNTEDQNLSTTHIAVNQPIDYELMRDSLKKTLLAWISVLLPRISISPVQKISCDELPTMISIVPGSITNSWAWL